MKLESKVFRDAANIYLWDGCAKTQIRTIGCCFAIEQATIFHSWYTDFFQEHFKPRFASSNNRAFWWRKGWRFWTQAAVQRHRKKMLLKAADLVDKMNGEGK